MKYNPQIHHRRSIRLKGYDYSQEGAYFITICCHDRKHFFGTIENGTMKLNAFGKIAYEQWRQLPERFPNIELDVFQIMPNHMHGIIVITDVGAPLAGARDVVANDVDVHDADAHDVNVYDANVHDEDVHDANVHDENVHDANVHDANTHDANVHDADAPDPDAPITNPGNSPTYRVSSKRAQASRAPTTVGDIMGAYKSIVADKCLELWKSKRPDQMMGKLWQRNFYERIICDDQSLNNIREYIINNPGNWDMDSENK